jgi:glutamate dehydrogenase/leucine dehydrogenase
MRNMHGKFEFLGNAGLAVVTSKEASWGLEDCRVRVTGRGVDGFRDI